MNAGTSREQLEAGPESLFMSHRVLVVALSEHAVLGVMIHEISQTLALGFFLILIFCTFPVLLWNNHITPPFICMFIGLLTSERKPSLSS